jgi:hypothetical protein
MNDFDFPDLDKFLDGENTDEKKVNLRPAKEKLCGWAKKEGHNHFAWLVAVVSPGEIKDGFQTAGVSVIAADISGGWTGKVKVMERVPVANPEPMPETFKNSKEKRKWMRAQKYVEVARWKHAEVIAGPFVGISSALARAEAMKQSNLSRAAEIIRDKNRAPQFMSLALSAPPEVNDIEYWGQKPAAQVEKEERKAKESAVEYSGTEWDF